MILALSGASLPAAAATTASWIAPSGSWSIGSNWDIGQPPDGDNYHAVINPGVFGSVQVYLDMQADIGELTIGSGNSLWFGDGQSLSIVGNGQHNINNSGTINIVGEALQTNLLVVSTTVRLRNGGVVILSGGPFAVITSPPRDDGRLINLDNTIRGAGIIGAGELALTNSGVIEASQPGQTLHVWPNTQTVTNTGTLRAVNGGRLRVQGTYTNTQGTIHAATGSRAELEGAHITNGTLSTAGTGLISTTAVPGSLRNVALNGIYELQTTQLSLRGTITNNGTLSAVGSSTLLAAFSEIILPVGQTTVTLSGTGTLSMFNGKIHSGSTSIGPRLVNGPTHTIRGQGLIGADKINLTNNGIIIADQPGALVIDPADNATAYNYGTVRATGAGGIVITDCTFTNGGLMEVLQGSKVIFTSAAAVTNNVAGTLTGGRWSVIAGTGTAELTIPTGSFQVNAAEVTLSGVNSLFNQLSSLYANAGQLTLLDGRQLVLPAWFNNESQLKLGPGAALRPNSDFTQTAAGRTEFQIGGPSPAQHGQIVATGAANLDGTLRVMYANGYAAPVGQQFTLIGTGAAGVGTFSDIEAYGNVSVAYSAAGVTVTVLPRCNGDVNDDGVVNQQDIDDVLNNWGSCPNGETSCHGDGNDDGYINHSDLIAAINGC